MHDHGCLGQQGLALTEKLISEEIRKFPALEQRQLELDDVIQDFLVDRIKPLTIMLMAQASNEDSFGRLLRRSIRNWLIDRARATGIGALRRSIEKVLSEESEFEKVPAGDEGAGRWRLVGEESTPWAGDLSVLVTAAWQVPDVRVPKWSSSSRRPPIADRASMVAIARAVLSTAAGSLETAQVVAVFARRFAAALDPIEMPLSETESDEIRSAEPAPEDLVVALDSEVDAASAAAEIFARLSESERAILPVLANSSEVQKRLGLGRSQSAHVAARLKAKIRDLAGTGPEAEQVTLEVIWLCGGPTTQ
ncbi:hypothetical protein [Rhodococcus koreensis]|uniref:hypothetical protein n=1 Tax=Rhodococcus koreensis TaxID=99653 RepID=UPI0011614A3F|nr:hypothetical protein [Rhodococcus koreensis]